MEKKELRRRVENNKAKGFCKFGALHKNENRDKTIRVTSVVKDKLKTMGASGNDNDDDDRCYYL